MQEQVYTVKSTTNKTQWFNERGKLHRLDGPAVEWAYGSKYWFQEGKLHRLDGPAFEGASGTKSWWQNDQLHRIDGPAVERADGDKEWYIQGEELTEPEFLARTQPRELSLDEIAKKFGMPAELLRIKKD